jgi:hypothetical protein
MSDQASSLLHVAVALEGAGWHPAAWREPDARPEELFDANYWADLVAEAERGMIDFVTIEDSLGLQSSSFDDVDDRRGEVPGRLNAGLMAPRLVSREVRGQHVARIARPGPSCQPLRSLVTGRPEGLPRR